MAPNSLKISSFVSPPDKMCCILFREQHQLQEMTSKYRGLLAHTGVSYHAWKTIQFKLQQIVIATVGHFQLFIHLR